VVRSERLGYPLNSCLIDILHYKGIANEDQHELIQALALFSERTLDIVDCILCVKATNAEIRLLSFDDALNKVNASLRVTGREIQ
jgi:predicted nucleic-acid-binding protein